MMKKILYILLSAMLVSCGIITNSETNNTRLSQYPKMYDEAPVSILVMPPINNTTSIEAKELLYTSISKPLAEAGYYIISPHLSMDILKAESAYDAELFVNASLDNFAKFFGADAVIFSQIDRWEKVGIGIDTKIRYFIRSTKTNEIIFDRTCDLFLDLTQRSNINGLLGLLIDLTATLVTTAMTDHIEAARKANYFIFTDLPRGKYNPDFNIDKEIYASEKNIKRTVR